MAKEIGRTASGKNGIISAGKKEGAAAGIEMFNLGGNAADAAVSSLLARIIHRAKNQDILGSMAVSDLNLAGNLRIYSLR